MFRRKVIQGFFLYFESQWKPSVLFYTVEAKRSALIWFRLELYWLTHSSGEKTRHSTHHAPAMEGIRLLFISAYHPVKNQFQQSFLTSV